MRASLFVLLGSLSCGMIRASDFTLPGPSVRAPVVHIGRYHILTCGRTSVVLDGARGMTIGLVGEPDEAAKGGGAVNGRLQDITLRVELSDGGTAVNLDQANDPSARLQIISQGPVHVAARVFFCLCAESGSPFGTGTMDIYVYDGRINLAPSIFVDDLGPAARIRRAGLFLNIPQGGQILEVKDRKPSAKAGKWFEGFGGSDSGFDVTVVREGGSALKVGWLRNIYPQFLYLRDISANPERDELYEKWPLWISQRGSPLGWRVDDESGLEGETAKSRTWPLAFLWVKEGRAIPRGGYIAFNAPLAIVLGGDRPEAESLWENFARPLKPAVARGDFRFYNEIEGVYEVDSLGGTVDLSFDGSRENIDRPVVVRLWNLEGRGAHKVETAGKPAVLTLLNDGDLVEDPMVFIDKKASGPARQAVVSLTVPKGKKTRLTVTPQPGLQLTYQMYSELETYEAWSDRCEDQPLFRVHLRELAVYQATLPGKRSYAFFKLPLYMMKNGVNPATFMDHLRQFEIVENGPEVLVFSVRGVNLQATGMSSYMIMVPYEMEKMTFDISAEFVPLDDGERWSSLEYCDLYPFEDVYRRNFHYRDVIFLTRSGVFDRVGAGAWGMRFQAIEEPEKLGYSAAYVSRSGPGSRVPHPQDGSIWILGDNAERGNILFRRVPWEVSAGAEPVFTLCNAWMDVHNVIVGRSEKGSPEKLRFALEVFPGRVPSIDALNTFYQRDIGAGKAVRIKSVRFSKDGEIQGFVPEK